MLGKQKLQSRELHHPLSAGGIVVLLTGAIAFTVALPAPAEIYRWTDEDGKVHFSDRPPRDREAEDISARANSVNVDNSSDEREKLGRLFAKETEEEKQLRLKQEAAERQQREKNCARARRELEFFQQERFHWVDEDGETSNASEEERQQTIEGLTAAVKHYCD